MSKKNRWFDCVGQEIFPGDTVCCRIDGKFEKVYECHPEGRPDLVNMGLNASNEKFLELHPERRREVYPFDEFAYYVKNGQRWLADYEKVV